MFNNLLILDSTIELRVGLYNYLPILDDNDTTLQSYADYITRKWNERGTNITLQVITGQKDADGSIYDPYGDLSKYLGDGKDSFDLIETDMMLNKELIDLVVELDGKDIKAERYIPATVEAVKSSKNNSVYLGFPTLACGNFITQVRQGNETIVELKSSNYTEFTETADKAVKEMVSNNAHKRLLGGNLFGSEFYYSTSKYIDTIVDVVGANKWEDEIKNLLNGKPNQIVLERFGHFLTYFQDENGHFGSQDDQQIIKNIVEGKTAYFFGFSERLSLILKEDSSKSVKPVGVFSPPFGNKKDHALLYTDALVINKKKAMESDEKAKAMKEFAEFFTSTFIKLHNVLNFK